VRDAIAAGNAAAMQTIKGIGAKTAQRLVVDLKDKILKIHGIDQILPVSNNTTKEQALSALEVLGFSRKASEGVIDKILKNTTDLSVEGLIKEALKNM
jgi:Holliday junction DNA helicase RuvA